MTFRDKMVKLCKPEYRQYKDFIDCIWCNKFKGICSSRTCKLGDKKNDQSRTETV